MGMGEPLRKVWEKDRSTISHMEVNSSVWVPHEELGYAKAQVVSDDGDIVSLEVEDTGEEISLRIDEVIPIHGEEDLSKVENLTELLDLNSASLLEALQERFDNKEIYTFTGQVLIAVNPFQRLKKLYHKKVLDEYLKADSANKLRPHAYGVAHAAFQSMIMNSGRNQSVLVSGESGAGKTETTKIVLNYLTTVSQEYDHHEIVKPNSEQSEICTAVLQTNALLEAFGNAKTVRNDNSSRFGKLIQLQFDPSRNNLVGATIDTYLLEKARITRQSFGERNFHIFYELSAGADESLKDLLKMPDLRNCLFTNQSGVFSRQDVSDKQQFQATLKAMDVVGINEQERERVFRVVVAVLYLGNITFRAKETPTEESTFADDAATKEAVENAAHLLELSPKHLETALCTRSIATGGKGLLSKLTGGSTEHVSMAHTVEQANEARNALAMTLYQRLFYWMVWKVNLKLGEVGQDDDIRRRLSDRLDKLNDFAANAKRNAKLNKTEPQYIQDCSIGCLDIFGFEVFESNSFEQLCINYANEVLQQQFNTFVFKDEQRFYESEGIDWTNIDFPDNMDCIRMIEGDGKVNVGLLKLLDEECMYPKGNDRSLHAKLMKNLSLEEDLKAKVPAAKKLTERNLGKNAIMPRKSGHFLVNHRTQRRELKFSISHFAGEVEYDIRGFYAKNKDELRREAVGLLRGSLNSLVRVLLPNEASSGPQDSTEAGKYFQGIYERTRRGRKGSLMMRGSLQRHGLKVNLKQNQKIQQKTVGKQFKDQLYQAMKHIRSSEPHYVRCIKPNDELSPNLFDRKRVLEQLNYSGVLEVVRVARAGYSTRFPHPEFLGRFRCLALSVPELKDVIPAVSSGSKKMKLAIRSGCQSLLEATTLERGVDYEVGKTMVMFRSDGFLTLEAQRKRLIVKFVKKIQRWYKKQMKRFEEKKREDGALVVQRVFRGYMARKDVSVFRAELALKRKIEAERKRKAEEEQKRLEEAKRKAEEEERLRIEEEEKQKQLLLRLKAEEEARLRREEIERLEAEQRRLREIEENKAAVKIQSFCRVILAQNRANALYEEREKQKELINDAANVVIDVFRENLRRKKMARERALKDNQGTERVRERKTAKKHLKKFQNSRNRALVQPLKSKSRATNRISTTSINSSHPPFEKAVYALSPFVVVLFLTNPHMLFFILFFCVSAAAGATLFLSAQKRKEYLSRKKSKIKPKSLYGPDEKRIISYKQSIREKVIPVELYDDASTVHSRKTSRSNGQKIKQARSRRPSGRSLKKKTTGSLHNSRMPVPKKLKALRKKGSARDLKDGTFRSSATVEEGMIGGPKHRSKRKTLGKLFGSKRF